LLIEYLLDLRAVVVPEPPEVYEFFLAEIILSLSFPADVIIV